MCAEFDCPAVDDNGEGAYDVAGDYYLKPDDFYGEVGEVLLFGFAYYKSEAASVAAAGVSDGII